MGNIETTYDLSRDLTVVKATGKITEDDLKQWAEDYYADTFTALILWDITEANITESRIEQIVRAASGIKQLGEKVRQGGKLAIVIYESTHGYESHKLPLVHAEVKAAPYAWKIFTSIRAAMEWLSIMQTDYAQLEP